MKVLMILVDCVVGALCAVGIVLIGYVAIQLAEYLCDRIIRCRCRCCICCGGLVSKVRYCRTKLPEVISCGMVMKVRDILVEV